MWQRDLSPHINADLIRVLCRTLARGVLAPLASRYAVAGAAQSLLALVAGTDRNIQLQLVREYGLHMF